MQQDFKTMMGQMGPQNSQFSNMNFPPSSPFNYPPPSTTEHSTSIGTLYQPTFATGPSTFTVSPTFSAPAQATPAPAASEAAVAVDILATKLEAAGPEVVKNEAENKSAAKKSGTVPRSASTSTSCFCIAVDIVVHPPNF